MIDVVDLDYGVVVDFFVHEAKGFVFLHEEGRAAKAIFFASCADGAMVFSVVVKRMESGGDEARAIGFRVLDFDCD